MVHVLRKKFVVHVKVDNRVVIILRFPFFSISLFSSFVITYCQSPFHLFTPFFSTSTQHRWRGIIPPYLVVGQHIASKTHPLVQLIQIGILLFVITHHQVILFLSLFLSFSLSLFLSFSLSLFLSLFLFLFLSFFHSLFDSHSGIKYISSEVLFLSLFLSFSLSLSLSFLFLFLFSSFTSLIHLTTTSDLPSSSW
jgi:hypothetical protein